MDILLFTILFCLSSSQSKAGVTEIPPDQSSDEVAIETVSETLMSSNIFDVGRVTIKEKSSENPNNLTGAESWDGDSNPIFRAIRDFIFQASDGLLETTDSPIADPTEEIVKIIEKGLIEATTMFLTPSDDENFPAITIDDRPEPIKIVKIEESPSMLNRFGVNVADVPIQRQTSLPIVGNATTACSNCYSILETCVQQCFSKHNCHEVQRQVRMCPPSPARLCNFFTQWSPVDECKDHGDCKSPLLCCNDGCFYKCTEGVWKD